MEIGPEPAVPPIKRDAALQKQDAALQNQDESLRDAARELEANFLAEMLKSAGVGKTPEGFGGGAGEDQFASFLRLEQARQMSLQGGVGLAESIYHALKERLDD